MCAKKRQKETSERFRISLLGNGDNIRCEMAPTSSGGEEQISLSGGSQSPI